jgi:hypothetical protein
MAGEREQLDIIEEGYSWFWTLVAVGDSEVLR